MKNLIFFTLSVLISISVTAQDPIFTPLMDITSYGIVDSPFGEEADKIIDDDINTKFLDFELDDGIGFTVDLGGLSYIATSMRITTANDFEERDPVRYEVLGSIDGISFTSIADGIMDCIPDRFFTRTYDFINDISYMHYRVDFTNACDPTGGDGIPSMQVAETQLYGTILGVNDMMLANELIIYPNPISNFLTIDNSLDIQIESIKIYDVLGRLVLQENEHFNSIDVSQLNSGILFVKLETARGILTKKVVKE